ncbi:MAG: hypothetical protein VX730_02610 [Pseudomonadota bacterium]|nr:hypothetical protein [Pseudomonadota bacterium]
MMTQNHWNNRQYVLMHDDHACAANWSQQTSLEHLIFPLSGPDLTLLTADAILILVEPSKDQVESIIKKCPHNPLFVIGENAQYASHRIWAKLPKAFLDGDEYLNKTFLPLWRDGVLMPSDDVGAFKSAKF